MLLTLVKLPYIVYIQNVMPNIHQRESTTEDQPNPINQSFGLLGDQWNLLIVQVLLSKPSRFNDIKRSIPQINNRTLSARLKNLADFGVLDRKIESGNPPFTLYHLTALGKGIGPIIKEIVKFGNRFLD
jgi:DNA-binding HxlR family transcriptional regulator